MTSSFLYVYESVERKWSCCHRYSRPFIWYDNNQEGGQCHRVTCFCSLFLLNINFWYVLLFFPSIFVFSCWFWGLEFHDDNHGGIGSVYRVTCSLSLFPPFISSFIFFLHLSIHFFNYFHLSLSFFYLYYFINVLSGTFSFIFLHRIFVAMLDTRSMCPVAYPACIMGLIFRWD